MTIKKLFWLGLAMLAPLHPARAAVHPYVGSSYGIPNGNLSGISSAITVSGENFSLSDIKVNLTLTGGFNGDLYAYLSYNSASVVLINRIGVGTGAGMTAFGNTTSGFTVTLGSTGTDIHSVTGAGVISGSYLADGRAIDPLSSAASFDAAGTQNLNGTFGGMNPNGTWTLFFADVSGGGGPSTLAGWSLDITAVPEPANVALGIFGGIGGIVGLVRWRRKTKAEMLKCCPVK